MARKPSSRPSGGKKKNASAQENELVQAEQIVEQAIEQESERQTAERQTPAKNLASASTSKTRKTVQQARKSAATPPPSAKTDEQTDKRGKKSAPAPSPATAPNPATVEPPTATPVERRPEPPTVQQVSTQTTMQTSEQASQRSAKPPAQVESPQTFSTLQQFFALKYGLHHLGQVFHNLGASELYEHIIFLREGVLSGQGAVMVETTPNTKLSVRDKFIVEEDVNKANIAWGEANRPIDRAKFNALKARLGAYLQRRNVYVNDCFAGSDPRLRVPFRIVSEQAWQSLFVRNMFQEASAAELRQFEPRMTILSIPCFKAIPEIDGTRAETFILYDFAQRLAIIGGTRHAEEIKKAVFTVMSYAMPLRQILPMRCAAVVSAKGETALFFGANGSGKTTLSDNPAWKIIGDDAHGWSDDGVFAFETGRYAAAAALAPELATPGLAAMGRGFGAILENVNFEPTTRAPKFADRSLADNPRVSASLAHTSAEQPLAPNLRGAHPKRVVFLINDGFGVLPPVAKLSREQALALYLSGYTVKYSGAEELKNEPRAIFSAGFGEAFMVQDPALYANLFDEKLRKHPASLWLVNTGASGGTQATAPRIKREYARAVLEAIVAGALDSVPTKLDDVFGVAVPTSCPGLPPASLNPRSAWSNQALYDKSARKLRQLLQDNIKKYAGRVDSAIISALGGVGATSENAAQKAAPAPTAQAASPKTAKTKDAPQTKATKSKTTQSKSARGLALKQETDDQNDTDNDETLPSGALEVPLDLFASEPQGAFEPDDAPQIFASSELDNDGHFSSEAEDGEQQALAQINDEKARRRGRRGGRGRWR
jgi:phosphoenolpyruvate carboxykinase (ATP)